ncbi:MAG TPA: uroporphyrinogen-III synthase [Gammaproteobacteria bacterium]|nr:uroporphyrinogen-III synthase [Gammaproteobacteria bacterium]
MPDLDNMGVLVTRPYPEGERLCEKIRQLGGSTVYLPVIEFAPSSKEVVSLNNTDAYDWVIFISPRAVEYGLPKLGTLAKTTRIAAVGQSTAALLQVAGVQDVIYPKTHWTSEGLLALPVFSRMEQQTVLRVSGEGGRDTLARTLAARGAIVEQLPVYRRVVPVYNDIHQTVEKIRQKKIDITVCTSFESLHNLMAIVGPENQAMLTDMTLIVVSQRLVDLAKTVGFQTIFLADNASDEAIIQTLYSIKGKGHVR